MSQWDLLDRFKQTKQDSESVISDRLAHRIRLFEWMIFIGCTTVAIFSIVHAIEGMHAMVMFQLPFLFINVLNLILLRFHLRLQMATNIMLGTIFIFLIGTALMGGIANTGALWLPIFPILAFLLVGKGGGVYWIVGFNIVILYLALAELIGYDITPYVADFVAIIFASTLVMSIIVYIYENQRQSLVDELEIERIRAEEASKAKSQFLANMSHEIRTPMNGIIGLTDIMMNNSLSKENVHHVQLIQTASETLLGVIDDILDISKIEAHKIEIAYQSIELSKLLQELVGLLKPGANAKGIRLEYQLADDLANWVKVDPLRLRQILLNIVGNAIKFTQEGEVSIIVERIDNPKSTVQNPDGGWRGSMLHFMVRDTGIGIAPDKIKHVFDQFSQADSTMSRQYGGSGLGLAISRELAEMMGGAVSANSGVGEGSIFHLYLPLIEADRADEKEIDRSQLPEKFDLNVLVAEDDRINQFVITRFLNDLGCTVECVDNGEKAVEAVKTGKYALILMDLHMPLMDGREATQLIRRQEQESQHIPIIALTANVISGEREACIQAGMDDFMVKPLHPQRLREVLARFDNK